MNRKWVGLIVLQPSPSAVLPLPHFYLLEVPQLPIKVLHAQDQHSNTGTCGVDPHHYHSHQELVQECRIHFQGHRARMRLHLSFVYHLFLIFEIGFHQPWLACNSFWRPKLIGILLPLHFFKKFFKSTFINLLIYLLFVYMYVCWEGTHT